MGKGNSVRGRAHPHPCSPRPVVPGPPPSPPSAQAAMLQHPPSAPHLSSLSHLADSPQELLPEGCSLRSRGCFWSCTCPLVVAPWESEGTKQWCQGLFWFLVCGRWSVGHRLQLSPARPISGPQIPGPTSYRPLGLTPSHKCCSDSATPHRP